MKEIDGRIDWTYNTLFRACRNGEEKVKEILNIFFASYQQFDTEKGALKQCE